LPASGGDGVDQPASAGGSELAEGVRPSADPGHGLPGWTALTFLHGRDLTGRTSPTAPTLEQLVAGE